MSDSLAKVLSIFQYVLMAVSVLLMVILYYQDGGIDPEASIDQQEATLGSILHYSFIWTYILVLIAAAGAIIFPIVNMIVNPKSAKKSIIPIIVMLVIFFVAYGLSSDEVVKFHNWEAFYLDMFPKAQTTEEVEMYAANVSKQVGVGLWIMYILAVGALLSILYSEVSKLFR